MSIFFILTVILSYSGITIVIKFLKLQANLKKKILDSSVLKNFISSFLKCKKVIKIWILKRTRLRVIDQANNSH